MSLPHDEGEDLAGWLDAGQAWLADVQACGLAGASAPLCAAGRAWADAGRALGWTAVAQAMGQVLDRDADPMQRASALLDIRVWVATAHSLRHWPLD